ncbi:MAG: HEAT repeat domain-containing protein, partial [Chthoniobacteraceae bacterium]
GDRGINVTSKEGRKFEFPDTGCIMRCNPDGTNFEVFATGVRNPQELAFNEFGDLFTGDNNSDAGDRARFLHLVEGGDYGWRMPFQYLADRGPWNREKLWDEQEARAAKYLIPPVANLSDGPSGLTYNPGTALGEKYRGQFYLSDFRGGANASVVHQIALEPAGAWFHLKERRDFVKGILTSDVEFGPDGSLYVLDWVESWGGARKGRIYRFSDPEADQKLIEETKKLIADGAAGRGVPELVKLLAHPDQRVRQAAQFELAARGKEAVEPLSKAAQSGPNTLARLHAIWGLGQISQDAAVPPLLSLLGDGDAEVRAQSAKVLGDRHFAPAAEKLMPLLSDPSSRTRFQAAVALGKLKFAPATGALFHLLAENNDQDPILRHGAVMGLVGCANPEQLAGKAGDGNSAVRIGAIVALRRLGDPAVANFLKDGDESVVLEAARAINDAPINAALPALAGLLAEATTKNPRVLERAINAAYRLGGRDQANALAAFAAKGDAPEGSRREALDALSNWANPDPKDRLLNQWRPLPPRNQDDAAAAIEPGLPVLFKDGPGGVQEEAAQVTRRLGIKSAGQSLADLVMNEEAPAGARTAALSALESLKDERLAKAAEAAMGSKHGRLRAEGLRALAEADSGAAVRVIIDVIQKGSPRAQQGAVLALTQIDKPEAKAEIARLMDQMIEGKCPPVIQLDVYEAAKKFGLNDQVQRFRDGRAKDDPLSNFRISLEGGYAGRGRKIFREKAEVSCVRCHKCEIGESAVGPDLTKIGAQKDRVYLLESIVFPNQHIADGFQTVALTLKDQSVLVGRLLSEDGQNLRVETFDEKGQTQEKTVPIAEVAQRVSAPSPMPENIRDQLSRSELRDLVEYLATRK